MTPYFPATHRSRITYQVFQIEGVYDPPSKTLSVTSRTPAPTNGTQIIWCVRVPSPQPTVFMVTTLPGQPEPTADNIDALYRYTYLVNGTWDAGDDFPYVGEANSQLPFQAILAINPVVGEVHNMQSRINSFTNGQADPEWVFHYQYATVSKGAWGPWGDCVRTSCIENDGTGAAIVPINYVFARGIGLVNYWKGVVAPDGTLEPGTGYEWYATEWSGQ